MRLLSPTAAIVLPSAIGCWRRLPPLLAGLALAAAATTAVAQADARLRHAFQGMGEARSDDRFGSAIALSGNRAIVGMPNDETSGPEDVGAAYLFERVNGVWELERKFAIVGPDAGAGIGSSVAIDTDIVVIGAPRRDVDGSTDQGVAYVFTRDAASNAWVPAATLEAADGAAGDLFGSAVAVYDTYLLVGARSDNNGLGANQGSVYVFRRQINGSWTQEAKLTQGDASGSDNFGVSLAISVGASGVTAVVGADRHDAAGNNESGAAYVFFRSGTGWTQQAKLLPNIVAAGDRFGTSVAVQGDRAVVGAPLKDSIGADSGNIYIYSRSGSSWSPAGSLPGAAAGHRLGQAVAVFGTRVLGGSPGASVAGNPGRGTVRGYTLSGTDWVLQSTLTSSEPQFEASFGSAVALLGSTAMVGAPQVDRHGNSDIGEVTVFEASAAVQTLDRGDGIADDLGGYSVAVAGDTVLYGAPGENLADIGGVGAVYAWRRNGSAWTIQQRIVPSTVSAGMSFGSASAIAGDSAFIGAELARVAAQTRGAVFHYTRINNSFELQGQIVAMDGAAGDRFGFAMALSGDTLVVAAPEANVADIADAGAVYVFVRNGTGWSEQAKLTAGDLVTSTPAFGTSVAIDGDTVLVSSPSGGVQDQGLVFVFVRSGGGWTRQATLTGFDSANQDLFGQGLALRGNLAVIGAPGDDIGAAANRGSARVFFRSGSAWTETTQLTNPGGAANDQFGRAVAMTDDAVVVTANAADQSGNLDAGVAYAYARTASTLAGSPTLLFDATSRSGDFFGYAVAADRLRAVVGAPLQDLAGPQGNPDPGAAYVFDRLPTDDVFGNGFE
jgi:hypothetical protein